MLYAYSLNKWDYAFVFSIVVSGYICFFFFWSSFYGYLLVRGKIKLLKVVEKFMLIEEVTIYDFGYGR